MKIKDRTKATRLPANLVEAMVVFIHNSNSLDYAELEVSNNLTKESALVLLRALKSHLGLDIRHLFHMHQAILSKAEKKHFIILTAFFLITSFFDIIGIGFIGYFLTIMMNPSILFQLPILKRMIPLNWTTPQILILLGGSILIVFIIKTIISCIVQKKLISYCFKVGARIRVELMEKYLYAPYSYFISNHTSEIINQILNYTSNYSNLNLVSFMLMIVHFIFVCAILFFLLIFHPLITFLLIVIFFSMLLLYILFIKKRLYFAGQNTNRAGQQIVQGVQEALSGLKEVRVLSKEKFFLERVQTASNLHANSYGLIAIFQKLPFYFLESIMFVFIISSCIVEICLGMEVDLIVVSCGVLVTAGIRLLPSLYQISVAAVSIQSSKHTLEEIYSCLFHSKAVFENELTWPKKVENVKDDKSFSSIQFEKVSFQYPNSQKKAIHSISLEIKRGESIGIIGPSGAGKSTLIDLLLGLLIPTEGQILLDKMPIMNRRKWVKRFAYIPQSIYLLDATIKDNIVFGGNESTVQLARLKQVLKMAQLDDVIAHLPQGVDTKIGENGVKLSGGQRQRVALARAFYHERDIIVMDEATAALDNETEREVVESIKNLHQLKTLIIIAHRYTTVKHCDIIYRLNYGKIVDAGSFDEVIRSESADENSNLILETV